MAEDTEYFEEKMNATFGSPEGKEQPIRNALRGALWGALFLAFVGGMIWTAKAFAAPVYAAEADGVRIVLTDEKCTLKEVSNLPYKATWTEKGKTYNGCFTINQGAGVVVAYFVEDKSVAAIPMDAFKRVTFL